MTAREAITVIECNRAIVGNPALCQAMYMAIAALTEQQTNGDYIRAMPDDELAKFLCNFRADAGGGHPCSGCVAAEYCKPDHNGMIDWLHERKETP